MGGVLSSRSPPKPVLMIGVDGAGKTSILYKLQLGEVVTTIPTIGFSVETIECRERNVEYTAWDVGGEDKLRSLWKYYYEGVMHIIAVVDSTDRKRISEAQAELHLMLDEPLLSSAKLLVFANKQDLTSAMDTNEVATKLNLYSLQREWHIQSSSAVTGDGLQPGLDW
eukprot:CAMPEP_0119136478 /NCGR_PEP_ID=MMETSP1310-20130426/21492_1 /TAXON_ID=464262 /ORGANISM="Genus nov. species nov., Strain RCC2339" /LENGTH=167 /DNA_ID=CAMNT_0007127465 /DNA_START=81 /DNA_END=581 /DNA_ORIENTATION=+